MEDVRVQALPGMEDEAQVNALDEAQLRAAAARRIFEAREGSFPWLDFFYELMGRGWAWRQAAYIAWLAMPAQYREPTTQHELATEVLGLQSDRRLRTWRAENPAIEEEARALVKTRLFGAIPSVLEALIESASTPSGRNHADRRTFLELVGAVEAYGREGEALPEDLSDVGTAELRRRVRALRSGGEIPPKGTSE